MGELLASFLVLLGASAAMAQDVRPANETEIAEALVGCWGQEPTSDSMRLEEKGRASHYSICFEPDGQISAAAFGGSLTRGLEGVGGAGTFRVAGGKLHLKGDGDGWFFDAEELSCDLIMRLDVGMQFRNCVSESGETLANASYYRAPR